MPAGQSSGTGALTDFEDEKVRKDDILTNRDKAQRRPGQSLDGKGVQADEYKDNPANRRPSSEDSLHPTAVKMVEPPVPTPDPAVASQNVDRPGFDLGGSTGETHAGKGLGLGADAQESRKGWRLPRFGLRSMRRK